MQLLAKYLALFARADRGNIAIIFAFVLFVLFGSVALAIDVARGFSSRASMQQNLDAALLYVANEKARSGADYDEQQGIRTYFDGLNRQNFVTGDIDVSIQNEDNTKFTATAVATVQSRFAQVLGLSNLNVVVNSEATLTEQPVEMALVLDNTGSMAGAKIAGLRMATRELIATMFSVPNAAKNVSIGVVPFADYVNAGTQRRNEPWLYVPPDNSTTTNVCSEVPEKVIVPGSCQDTDETEVEDGKTKVRVKQQCQYTDGPAKRVCQDVTSGGRWNGCIGSRPYPLNVTDGNYLTSRAAGILDVTCPAPLTPPNNDEAALLAAANNLVASGETYIPSGLIWGWAMLTKAEPFTITRATVKGRPVKKIMVLMTDGANTKSVGTNGQDHSGNDTAQSNSYTSELCTNIRNAKIEIYTVAFEVTDSTIKGILEGCASGPSNYYEATNTSDLIAAFQDIANGISPIHLTR